MPLLNVEPSLPAYIPSLFSSFGAVSVPEEMKSHIDRFDFVLSPQATAPHNCSAISFGDLLCFHFIRNTTEPELEMQFHRVLQGMGITAKVESNRESLYDSMEL